MLNTHILKREQGKENNGVGERNIIQHSTAQHSTAQVQARSAM
jgi:hypothetical protein